jgi:hypothetical protein
MIFGRRSLGRTVTSVTSVAEIPGVRGLLAVLLVMSLALLAGCGGGGGGGGGNNGGGNPGTVTGRVIDQNNNNQPVAGATINIGSIASGTTATDGTFSISVKTNAGQQNLTITGPSGVTFFDYANVGGTVYRVRSTGIPVPSLSANQTFSLGDIVVLSDAGPPPPPTF